jgi:hypothetical protein
MTAESIDASSRDEQTLILVRVAALLEADVGAGLVPAEPRCLLQDGRGRVARVLLPSRRLWAWHASFGSRSSLAGRMVKPKPRSSSLLVV